MPFHFNGYSNFHDDNQDWIVSKIKSIENAEEVTGEYADQAKQSAENAAGSAEAAALSAEAAEHSAELAAESEQAVDGVAGDLVAQVQSVSSRLDTLIVDGQQTEGNTELIDIRTAFDGESYATAGSAVRGQASDDFDLSIYNQLAAVNPPYSGAIWSDANFAYKRFGNLLYLNGKPTSSVSRFTYYGDLYYAASQPSYSNHPEWYGDALTDFEIGHIYKIGIEKVRGSITNPDSVTGNIYIDMRTEGGSRTQVYDGDIWTCNFQPEMICIGLVKFQFDDAVVKVTFTDVTNIVNDFGLADLIEQIYEELNPYNVPDYFETMINANIAKVNNLYGTLKTDGVADLVSFNFITDVHWSNNQKKSPALLKRISENTPVSDIVCGGDIIYAHADSKTEACNEIRSFNGMITGIPNTHYYTIFGNHDSNGNNNDNPAAVFTKDEEFNLLYAEFAELKNTHFIFDDSPITPNSYPYRNDYYVERSRYRVRYLCIDWNNPLNSYRTNWITGLLAQNDGYRYIVFYHGIYAGTSLTPEHTQIMNVLEPYKNKIACVITGHAHVDGIIDYYGDGSVPVIVTDCDMTKAAEDIGTTDEQCFDTFVIDFAAGDIHIIRTGRGQDRNTTFTM